MTETIKYHSVDIVCSHHNVVVENKQDRPELRDLCCYLLISRRRREMFDSQ